MRDIEIVKDLPGTLRLGEVRRSGSLGVVPVFGGRDAPEYDLASAAMEADTLRVVESREGAVSRIEVQNDGTRPVLMVQGELLDGAAQDRVLNVTVLVPASASTEIPVSCVERGRSWYRDSHTFASSPYHSPATLRHLMTASVAASHRRAAGDRRSDQAGVWAEIERKRREVGGFSPTSAMRDTFDRHFGRLEAVRETFADPHPEQTGVIACVGGRAVAFEAFDSPETFRRLWTRLLFGYAMEALGAEEHEVEGEPMALLHRIADAKATAHDGVGLGTEVMLTEDGFAAGALVWHDAVVHVSAFTATDSAQGTSPAA